MNAERSFHHQRRPPDVEEALSSMLWTPYERTATYNSSDEDDQLNRTESINRLHNNYDHRITYEPITSTYPDDDGEMSLTATVTTSIPTNANVGSSLQSTPSVPFANVIYNSNNNNDYDNASSSKSNWDPTKSHSNRKQPRSGGFRFSYPYYGPNLSFNKWCSSSASSKEPPPYESLYANGPTALVVGRGFDESFSGTKSKKQCIKEESSNIEESFSFERERSLRLLSQLNFGRSLSSSSENGALFTGNESHIELESKQSNGPKAITKASFKETRATNGESQQTEEYNNMINNNKNSEGNDNDVSKSKKIKEHNPQMHFQLTSSQSNATTRATKTEITGATDASKTERLKPISHNGEGVSQPVSCIDNNKTSLPASNLRTTIINNHSNNNIKRNDHIVPNKRPLSSEAYPYNEALTSTATMSPLRNLFDASWSDKATSTESGYDLRWENVYNEYHTQPTVVDAVAIIQSSTCSLSGRVSAHRSRSSFVTLQSYSHLWKKTLRGARTKVKRTKRSSVGSAPFPHTVAPLDTLTPNKCLAELERLYAEFWASESALGTARTNNNGSSTNESSIPPCLSPSHSDSSYASDSNCDYGCELLTANSNDFANINESTNKMRLDIPAEINRTFCLSAGKQQSPQMHNLKVLPTNSTSSVFLTSSDCTAIRCLTSDDNRPKGNIVSDDDRCSNLLHETKNNYGDCANIADNHKINNNNEEDHDVGIVQNDECMVSNNNETIAMIETPSAIKRQKSNVTIQVNSGNSDQNNNNSNNCVNNKNNAELSEDKDCVGVEGDLVILNIGQHQRNNIFESNGVCVVNCNYSSVYTINNDNNNSICELSPTYSNTATTTPVRCVNVNKSVNQVSPVPNVFCNGKTSVSSDIIAGVHAAKNGSNGNAISNVRVTDRVNIISVSGDPQATQALAFVNTSARASQTKSMSTTAISSETSRTFASAECQTDEILSVPLRSERTPISPISQRAQRRRDRRGRRQLQQQLSTSYPHPHHLHMPSPLRHSVHSGSVPFTSMGALNMQPNAYHMARSAATTMPAAMSALLRPMLPDLLHRNFPPPYTALPLSGCGAGTVTLSASTTMVGSIPPSGATILTPMISTVPMPAGAPPVLTDGPFTLPLPIIRRSPSERSGKGCCGQWFAGPPLRALIAVVALGGVACALGGAALGATGLPGPPSSHFTAALLMLGVGVVLVTVSGAAWRMTAPGGPPCLGLGSSVDLGRCGRRPYGRGGGTAHGLLYPEFQHRPPPPSYQASMQEFRLRLLLLDRDRQNGVVQGNSPPPTYRSYVGSLLRAPLTVAIRRGVTTSSVVGTSEYSLPPSYRSRNTTSAAISTERSAGTPSSHQLLVNEGTPEPSAREQFSKSNSTDSTLPTLPQPTSIFKATPISYRQVQTSAIVEIESINCTDNQSHGKNENRRAREALSKDVDSTPRKDLVTIVTISKNDGQEDRDRPTNGEHIEILAHL